MIDARDSARSSDVLRIRGCRAGARGRRGLGTALAPTALALALAALAAPPIASASPWQLGVAADVGVPDGGTASLTISPMRLLRLEGGLSHNLVSRGWRAGLALVPLRTWATPVLSLDYGRYAEGDANELARRASGDPLLSSSVLERVGYDYANAHVGLELGRRWCTFYLQAGASRVTTVVHGLNAELREVSTDPSTQVTFTTDPRVTVWAVSARAGLRFYLTR
ncbi:MAG: hypothetical protein R3B48_16840 [Kofleriaceae bacterium]